MTEMENRKGKQQHQSRTSRIQNTGLLGREGGEYRREEITREITQENFQNCTSHFQSESTHSMKTDVLDSKHL